MPGVKDTLDSSDLTRRISIQAPVYTSGNDDGQGGGYGPNPGASDWQTVYSCWANIQNFPHGRGLFKKFLYQQLYPTMTTTIQIRYQQSVAITDQMRVSYTAHGVTHSWQILGIENPLEGNVSLWLLCQELQAQPVN